MNLVEERKKSKKRKKRNRTLKWKPYFASGRENMRKRRGDQVKEAKKITTERLRREIIKERMDLICRELTGLGLADEKGRWKAAVRKGLITTAE